jgi:hypothetical protein
MVLQMGKPLVNHILPDGANEKFATAVLRPTARGRKN